MEDGKYLVTEKWIVRIRKKYCRGVVLLFCCILRGNIFAFKVLFIGLVIVDNGFSQ